MLDTTGFLFSVCVSEVLNCRVYAGTFVIKSVTSQKILKISPRKELFLILPFNFQPSSPREENRSENEISGVLGIIFVVLI